MTAKNDLKTFELKAFTSVFEDGLWDLYLGWMVLSMGLSILLDDLGYWLSEYWILVLMPLSIIPFLLKRWITVPRLGRVKFGAKRRNRLMLLTILFTIVFLIGLVNYRFPERALLVHSVAIGAPALTWFFSCVIIFSITAYLLSFPRLYLYGILFALPYPFRIMMKQVPGWYLGSSLLFFISSGIMLAIGVCYLRRFLQKYPKGNVESNQMGASRGTE